jgi:hypothetical protein
MKFLTTRGEAMKTILVSLALLLAGVVTAQTALDPTQGGAYPKYPAYLDHSCGGITQTQYGEQTNADSSVTGAFRFYTNCNGAGRGAKDTRYLSCWAVTFAADRYTVTDRTLLLYATWKQGQTAVACPAL